MRTVVQAPAEAVWSAEKIPSCLPSTKTAALVPAEAVSLLDQPMAHPIRTRTSFFFEQGGPRGVNRA
ncbi:hypothetical protein B0H17DRAFT_1103773 [Mycena rosella]|uniref:Uncharacterized protein n=1 Tax=Mycena rosella TaxID=1033263 RepID=A0AAD7CDE3_MYCRO|nr:hypothetical protein B0H17DRAFT_1103773 [Mycena rosella]